MPRPTNTFEIVKQAADRANRLFGEKLGLEFRPGYIGNCGVGFDDRSHGCFVYDRRNGQKLQSLFIGDTATMQEEFSKESCNFVQNRFWFWIGTILGELDIERTPIKADQVW